MAYARFDDRYDDHRKIKRALRREPAAVALHSMAITYCSRHESDGVIDVMQVEDWIAVLPYKPAQKAKVMPALLELGLFDRLDDEHLLVHNFLKWNDSKAQRERLRDAGRRGARARWAKGEAEPDGTPNADRNADRNGVASAAPNGPPHHTTPTPSPITPGKPADHDQPSAVADQNALPSDMPVRLAAVAVEAHAMLGALHSRICRNGARPPTLYLVGMAVRDFPSAPHLQKIADIEAWLLGRPEVTRQGRVDLAARFRQFCENASRPGLRVVGGGQADRQLTSAELMQAEREGRMS